MPVFLKTKTDAAIFDSEVNHILQHILLIYFLAERVSAQTLRGEDEGRHVEQNGIPT